MKFTANWLADHLDKFDLALVLERLPQIGLEVEQVVEPLALKGFALAEVMKVMPHPKADKLRIAHVRTKDGDYGKQIVCGAPNLREGQITILATPNSLIPATNTKLKPATIRGEESFGMLCSAAELGVGADSDGILDLDSKDLTQDPATLLGLDDWVITLETTPNRPDWAGVQGLARDLAASGCGTFKKAKPIKLKEEGASKLKIENKLGKALSACPYFVGRTMENITNKAAPAWMQQRLQAIGLRPISALVDITNYICFDSARPLHIYDADKIAKAIVLRMAKKDETLDALNGKDYKLNPQQCVIADKERTLALGGVMGGVYSSVSETTKNIFIESAWFDPLQTARTARNLNLHSDSSYRFERGVDPLSLEAGCDKAAQMVQEICGGTIQRKVVHGEGKSLAPKTKLYFMPAQIEKRAGVALSASKIKTFLNRLGFTTTGQGKKLATIPPSWRRDFTLDEGKDSPAAIAELTEEIIRLYGVDKVASTPLSVPHQAAPLSLEARRLKKARLALASSGLTETISWSFQSEAMANIFSTASKQLKLANPISEDLAVMRSSLLGGLLLSVARNLAYDKQPLALFEAGVVFHAAKPGAQNTHLAAVRQGRQTRHWQGEQQANLWQIKADMIAALNACGLDRKALLFEQTPPDNAIFHPAQSGVVKLGTKVLGAFGAFHPRVLTLCEVETPCVAFELNLDALPPAQKKKKTQKADFRPYTLMPVRRDFAFVLEKDIAASALVQAASAALKKIKHQIKTFDLFEQEKIVGEGKKSITIEITLFPSEVLRDEDINAYEAAVVQSVETQTGGRLRG